MKLLFSVICMIIISYICSAKRLNKGALPFTCGDGSLFGAPYNCNIPPSYPKDRRKNENSLRIMQFNADSLFLEGCASWDKFDARIPAAKTAVGAMSHLQTIANVIYKLNADIIIIDEVCDCCVLRELIRHMNRNHLSQTYQEYMLPTTEENGEHIGIITRVDPIDIWDANSSPKQLKSKYNKNTAKNTQKLEKDLARENELPPPPLPMDEMRRRLMINGRATRKKTTKKKTTYNPGPKQPKTKTKTKGKELKPPPKPLDKNGNTIKDKKKTVKGLKPPPPPIETKPKMIREKEYKRKPSGKMKHIAATFNVHLDKPLAIVGAQFADFSENNQRLRRNQAIDLARFVNLYQKDYHIIVVGDFQSVPEGYVLKRFSEDTGFKNIGYKYFDRDDFTYLSQLSMGMLDNIFTSQALYQKIQDTKIDYTHPRPIFPFSNHLPLVIDIDTTWFGGWGSQLGKLPRFKSIINVNTDNGEQKKEPPVNNNEDYNNGYGYQAYGGQTDGDHTNYEKDKPQLIGGPKVNIPPQDQMAEPPPPLIAVHKANVQDNDDYLYGYYEYEDVGDDDDEDDEDEDEEEDLLIDHKRYKPEKKIDMDKDDYDVSDSILTKGWLQNVLKWMIYALVGTFCLIIGACFGWFFVGFWKSYKGRVVHISRF